MLIPRNTGVIKNEYINKTFTTSNIKNKFNKLEVVNRIRAIKYNCVKKKPKSVGYLAKLFVNLNRVYRVIKKKIVKHWSCEKIKSFMKKNANSEFDIIQILKKNNTK